MATMSPTASAAAAASSGASLPVPRLLGWLQRWTYDLLLSRSAGRVRRIRRTMGNRVGDAGGGIVHGLGPGERALQCEALAEALLDAEQHTVGGDAGQGRGDEVRGAGGVALRVIAA